jgi:gluconate kinase
MKAEMLRSQFAALDEPEEAFVVDIDQDLDTIVEEIEGELVQ